MLDLAVVGAGIIGTMTAYMASQRFPGWRILMLDRSFCGQGATLYSVGLHFPYGRSDAQKDLATRSMRLYGQLKSVFPDSSLQHLPFVGFAAEATATEVLGRFATKLAHIATKREREQVTSSHRGLKIPVGQVLVIARGAGFGLPGVISASLVRQLCTRPSGSCWEGSELTAIDSVSDGYRLSLFDGRTVDARRVVVATGPWAKQTPGISGVESLGIRIKKVTALHVDASPPEGAAILYFFDEDAFLLPVKESCRWLFSFTSREWDCMPALTLRISPEERNAADRILERYWPAYRSCCGGGRVFCDAYSRDWSPVVIAGDQRGDLVFAGACSGAGFRLAPAIAEDVLNQLSRDAS
jgi:D-hydroxyproline dehydrogenase subunit beta